MWVVCAVAYSVTTVISSPFLWCGIVSGRDEGWRAAPLRRGGGEGVATAGMILCESLGNASGRPLPLVYCGAMCQRASILQTLRTGFFPRFLHHLLPPRLQSTTGTTKITVLPFPYQNGSLYLSISDSPGDCKLLMSLQILTSKFTMPFKTSTLPISFAFSLQPTE